MKLRNTILLLLLPMFLVGLNAQTSRPPLRPQVVQKINELKTLITTAESENVNVEKEKMTLRTAEVFLSYSDWDEANPAVNTDLYGSIFTYRGNRVDSQGRNLTRVVEDLPDIQRQQILDIIDKAMFTINGLRDGTITRKDLRTVNFENVSIKRINNEDRVVENVNGVDVPTLFYTYIFKPDSVLSDINDSNSDEISLNDFHGNTIDMFMTPRWYRENGTLANGFNFNFNNSRGNQNIGQVFMDFRQLPNHLANNNDDSGNPRSRNDSRSIYAGERLFTRYDIDNEDTRTLMENFYGTTVPLIRDENFTGLGYLLANEPHWGTIERTFFTPTLSTDQNCTSPGTRNCNQNLVSEFTMQKFATHLQEVYGTGAAGITALNLNWFGNDTSRYLSSFDDIAGNYNPNQVGEYAIEFPIKISNVGTPMVYDWFFFNNKRVTEWFQFLHDIIAANDPDFRSSIKLIPAFFFGQNARHAGLNFEALQEIQEIIGNDAQTVQENIFGNDGEWVERYNFDWGEMAVAYDFLSSVKPNTINYNSEAHYLSTTQFRNLYLEPSYTRASFWLAYMHGENVSNIWYLPRNEDGSPNFTPGTRNCYPGTIANQPAVANEVGSVFYDLNAYAEEVYKIQNLRKPIRIFHSETSAINKIDHMEPIFDLYETMYFDGVPIGFVTENILTKQDNSLWDVVLVYETPSVTDSEFNALQAYLDNGGTVVIDNASLAANEYNVSRPITLNTNNGGTIIRNNSLSAYRNIAFNQIEAKGSAPNIKVSENHSINERGCFWRTLPIDGDTNILTVVNTRRGNSTINIEELNSSTELIITDLLTGRGMDSSITLEPNDVLLLEVTVDNGTLSTNDVNDKLKNDELIKIYPNPIVDSKLFVDFSKVISKGGLNIYSINGSEVLKSNFANSSNEIIDISSLASGVYFLKINMDNKEYVQKIIKK